MLTVMNKLFTTLFYLVTENANFKMMKTYFSVMGFTQQTTAMPIIKD